MYYLQSLRLAIGLLGVMLFHVEPGWAEVQVQDDLGHTVTLVQPARRIVSLAPHLTEMLFAIGAGDRLVGVMAYSDYPPEAKQLPQVGSYSGLDLERILVLQPNLVLAWESGNPAPQLRKLKDLGINLFISEPRRLEAIPATLERLGVLTGSTETAGRAARVFRARLEFLRNRYQHRSPVSVFYQVWDRPLVTLNGEHLVSRIIDLCGGRNLFADLPTLAPHIGIEAVLAAKPEVIIASDSDNESPKRLEIWRRWAELPAVAHGNLFTVSSDLVHRPGPRIVQGAVKICEILEIARERLER